MVAGKSGPKPGTKKPGKANLSVVDGGKAPKPDAATIARGAGVNMSDENEAGLFFQNKNRYEALLAAKKKADADLRNHGKLVKSEMGERGLESIKLAIKLGAEGGLKELQDDIRMRERVARWMGMPLNSQADFDFTDRRPLVDRAYAEGKVAGMEGKTYSNPHDINADSGRAWDQGWKDGQEAIFNIRPLPTADVIKGNGRTPPETTEETVTEEEVDPGEIPDEETVEGETEEEMLERLADPDAEIPGSEEPEEETEEAKIARQRAEDDATWDDPKDDGPTAA